MKKRFAAGLMGARMCVPPQPEIGGEALGPPITMEVGTFEPNTATCTTAPSGRVPMHVRQPDAAGDYPVFLFLPGTGRRADNPTAIGIIERAASRGFVAASAEYASLTNLPNPPVACHNYDGKADCTFSVDDPTAPEAALNLLCNDLTVSGAAAGVKADCSQGVIVAGFSQGGGLAMLAQDHHPDVLGAWVMSFHDQALLDPVPLTCMHHDERSLPSTDLRLIVGESDWVLRTPHRDHIEDVTGLSCPTDDCIDATDEFGWAILADGECASGTCGHEYLDDSDFWTDAWWGANSNLDWLTAKVP